MEGWGKKTFFCPVLFAGQSLVFFESALLSSFHKKGMKYNQKEYYVYICNVYGHIL